MCGCCACFYFYLFCAFDVFRPAQKKNVAAAAAVLVVEREALTSIHDTSSLSNRASGGDSSLFRPKVPSPRKKRKNENTFTHLCKALKYPKYTVLSHCGCHKRKRTHKRRTLCGILTRGYESSLPASTNLSNHFIFFISVAISSPTKMNEWRCEWFRQMEKKRWHSTSTSSKSDDNNNNAEKHKQKYNQHNNNRDYCSHQLHAAGEKLTAYNSCWIEKCRKFGSAQIKWIIWRNIIISSHLYIENIEISRGKKNFSFWFTKLRKTMYTTFIKTKCREILCAIAIRRAHSHTMKLREWQFAVYNSSCA